MRRKARSKVRIAGRVFASLEFRLATRDRASQSRQQQALALAARPQPPGGRLCRESKTGIAGRCSASVEPPFGPTRCHQAPARSEAYLRSPATGFRVRPRARPSAVEPSSASLAKKGRAGTGLAGLSGVDSWGAHLRRPTIATYWLRRITLFSNPPTSLRAGSTRSAVLTLQTAGAWTEYHGRSIAAQASRQYRQST